MFQKLLIASAATVVAAATIAASASAAASPSQKPGATRFCISYHPVVGSRIGRVDCMTKTEWAREGVNVDKMIRG